MITKISLKDVACYKDEAILETDKPINLIYGLNGVGKTQISRLLANPNLDCFRGKSFVSGVNDEKVLVYNQEFIDKNFYQTNTQKGIFTLSNENVEIEKTINILQEELGELNTELKKTQQGLTDKIDDLKVLSGNLQEKIWNIKKQYGDDFKIIFKGHIGDKATFCNFIIDQDKCLSPLEKQEISIEELKKRYKIISDTSQQPLDRLSELSYEDFLEIENESIFDEVIVGNQDSVIANLIKEAGSEDWVRRGFDKYVKADSDICPFCQSGTITQDFRNSIKAYFDKTYEDKISELKSLRSQYEELLSNLPSKETFYRGEFLNEQNLEFKGLYETLQSAIQNNLEKIEAKIKEPSRKVELISLKISFENLNQYINEIQVKINVFNKMLDNKGRAKDELEELFWSFVISEYRGHIDEFKKEKNKNENEKQAINEDIEKLKAKITEKKQKIKEEQGKIANISECVENINSDLKKLGIFSFYLRIQNEKEQKYIIVRDNGDEPTFKTLSEGEKTLISFLYFLQLCQEQEDKNEVSLKKIIVIDDPISSLSFNYVYDIAVLIKNIFFKPDTQYEQVFILTHHLYFFHELLNVKDKIKKTMRTFRIFRDINNSSCIEQMQNNEIANNYEAYWQVLKDYRDQKVHHAIVPNVMRHILEHFFGFLYNEEFPKKKNGEQNAFYRLIDRESHSDKINLVDTRDLIDPEKILGEFKKIFEEEGFVEHYKKMIGENND